MHTEIGKRHLSRKVIKGIQKLSVQNTKLIIFRYKKSSCLGSGQLFLSFFNEGPVIGRYVILKAFKLKNIMYIHCTS